MSIAPSDNLQMHIFALCFMGHPAEHAFRDLGCKSVDGSFPGKERALKGGESSTVVNYLVLAGHRSVTMSVAAAFLAVSTPVLAQDDTAQAVGTAVGGMIGLLLVIVIGALVGWLAGLIVKGQGSGLLGNVAAGIGGSMLAGYALPLVGISLGGALGSFIAALIGAVALILIVRLIRKAAN